MIPTSNLIVAWILAAMGAVGGWWFTADHYQGVLAQEHYQQAKAAAELAISTMAAQDTIAAQQTEARRTHEQNRKVIADLRNQFVDSRVRLPASLCADYHNPNETSVAGTAAARVVPEELQGSFDRFTKRLESEAARADEVVEDYRECLGAF